MTLGMAYLALGDEEVIQRSFTTDNIMAAAVIPRDWQVAYKRW